MRRLLTTAALVLAAPAGAEDDAVPADSYRLPLVAADVASIGMLVVPLALDGDIDSDAALWTARAGVVFVAAGGTIVHAAYGENVRATTSLVARGTGGLLGLAIGRAIPCEDDNSRILGCEDDQMLIGALAGVGAVMVAEAIWFADKPVQKPRTAIVPYVAGTELGVAGRF